MSKFLNSYTRLLISTFISLIIGLYLVLYPENISATIIKLAGGLIIVNGGYFLIDILEKMSIKTEK